MSSVDPENIGQSILEAELQTQPASTSSAPQHSALRIFSRKVLPVIFMVFFLTSGTMVLIYTLVLHLPIPSTPAIAMAIIFGTLIVLFLFTLILLYFLERQKNHPSNFAEKRTKPKVLISAWRWERFKEWRANYEKPRLLLVWFYNVKALREAFTKKVRERWNIWMDARPKLREWHSGRFWRGWQCDNTTSSLENNGPMKVFHTYVRGDCYSPVTEGAFRPSSYPQKQSQARHEGGLMPSTKASDHNAQTRRVRFAQPEANIFLDQQSSVASSADKIFYQSSPHQSTSTPPSSIRQMEIVHPVLRTYLSHQQSTRGSILGER